MENFPDSSENELSSIIKYDLEMKPYGWMYIDAEAELDRRKKQIDNASADIYIDQSENLSYGGGYRYEKHESTQLTGYLRYDVNKEDWKRHWTFDIYERYDIQEKILQEQEYRIIKDLHCWTGEFTCRVEDESDYTFYVIFKLKAFPDMAFFFRTAYHRPRPGSSEKEYFKMSAMD